WTRPIAAWAPPPADPTPCPRTSSALAATAGPGRWRWRDRRQADGADGADGALRAGEADRGRGIANPGVRANMSRDDIIQERIVAPQPRRRRVIADRAPPARDASPAARAER